jgi:hypothetical protein
LLMDILRTTLSDRQRPPRRVAYVHKNEARRARRAAVMKAIRLIDAWHAAESIGPSDAFIWLALGGGGQSVGPEERRLSDAARILVRCGRHGIQHDPTVSANIVLHAAKFAREGVGP